MRARDEKICAMPTYEYACTSCGERTETKQSFHDAPLEECPHCGGRLRKLYSPVGIVFKGSGFYSTDSRKSGAPSKDEKPKKEEKPKEDKKPASTPTSTSEEKSA
jgi:putative FmdB family regulatory protein